MNKVYQLFSELKRLNNSLPKYLNSIASQNLIIIDKT